MAEPLLTVPLGSLNEALLDKAVAHQVGLLAYDKSILKQLSSLLDDATEELADVLERRLAGIAGRFGFDRGPVTTARMAAQLEGIKHLNADIHERLGKQLAANLEDLAVYEARFQGELLKGQLPMKYSLIGPSKEQLKSLVTSLPFEGQFYGEHVSDLAASQFKRISRVVQTGIVTGLTGPQIVRNVIGTKKFNYSDGAISGKKRRAEVATLVRTSSNHVTTQSRELLYKSNSDLIKGVQFVATLDGRTTLICEIEDGNVYDIGRGPRPPLHYNCRSTTVPVVKSFRELGLKGPQVTDNVRASMFGEVPAKLRYDQWLRAQSFAIQNQALGPVRGAIYRANPNMKLSRFADDLGRAMRLDQLAVFDGELILNLSDELFDAYRKYFGQMGGHVAQALNPIPEVLKGIPKTRMASWAGSEGMTTKQTMAMLAEAGHDTTINSVRTFLKYGRQGKNLPASLTDDQLAMLKSLKAKAEKAFPKKVVKPPPVAVVTVDEIATTRLISWMGGEGLSSKEIRAVLNAMGREAKENTIKTFRYYGTKGQKIPDLKEAQVSYLRGVVDASRKGATVVKPPVVPPALVVMDDVATSRLIAHFGSRGMSTGEIRAALRELGREAKDNTIKTFRYRGKKGDALPELSGPQRGLLDKLEQKIRGGKVDPIPAGAEVIPKAVDDLAVKLTRLEGDIDKVFLQNQVITRWYESGASFKEVEQLLKGLGWESNWPKAGLRRKAKSWEKDIARFAERAKEGATVLSDAQVKLVRDVYEGFKTGGKLPDEFLLRAKFGVGGDVKTFQKVETLLEEVRDQPKRLAAIEARERVLYERLAKVEQGSDAYEDLHSEIWDLKVARTSESVAFRVRLHEALTEGNKVNQKLKYKPHGGIDKKDLTFNVRSRKAGTSAFAAEREAKRALHWLEQIYQRRVNMQPIWVRHEGGKFGRAYHSGEIGKRTLSNIALPDKTDVVTAIHEYGHHLEEVDATLRKAISKFYRLRTKGDALRLKTGGEYYMKDEFIDWYIGKWYGSVARDVAKGTVKAAKFRAGSSEVLSMGLQMMWENPMQLYTKDKDMFDFILKIILDMELP